MSKSLSRRNAVVLLSIGAGSLLIKSNLLQALHLKTARQTQLLFRIESKKSAFGNQLGYAGAGVKEIDDILRLNNLYSEFHSTLSQFVSEGVLDSFELKVETPSVALARFEFTDSLRANLFLNSEVIKNVGGTLRKAGMSVSIG